VFRWLQINGHIMMEISAKVNFHLAKGKKGTANMPPMMTAWFICAIIQLRFYKKIK
jgi:hypothetical protein